MTARILIVDDEAAVTDLISYNLQKAGYSVSVAADGREALRLVQQARPDLILLDIMLPEMDGLDVCREIRKVNKTPIIMITARGEEVDRVVGLELGADDYVCKPFSMRELMARIKAVLRRSQSDEETVEPQIIQGPAGLSLSVESRQAFLQGRILPLTRTEFDLLLCLLQNNGHVLSRDRLLELAWGYDFSGESRAVDSSIKRLRAKLRAASPQADCIEAVRGVGYCIRGK